MSFLWFNTKQLKICVATFIAPILLPLLLPANVANASDVASHAKNLPLTTSTTGVLDKTENDGRHDFDFFSGKKWAVHGRKRIGRFIASKKFEEMDGFEFSRKIGDIGMLDEVTYPTWRPGFKLNILRIFDANTKKWSIYDVSSHGGSDSPPLVGSFHDGLGIFVGKDHIDGVDVLVRYTWTADRVHPRFQQEFSNDNGKTWEIDWNADFVEIK